MMRRLLLIFLILDCFYSCVGAQNLVPNPSFEDTVMAYPSEVFSFDDIRYWNMVGGTPDYYNRLDIWNIRGIPKNYLGYQEPHNGNAYIGIGMTSSSREYVQAKLLKSLIFEKGYKIQFYVSLSDSSQYASDNMGIYISINPPHDTGFYNVIPVIPQIISTPKQVIDDKTGWFKISGEYISKGDEKYLTIGNFYDSKATTITFVGGGYGGRYAESYYYIDDVSVVPVFDTAHAGRDTLICEGTSVIIGDTARPGMLYSWSPKAGLSSTTVSQPLASPVQSTTYVLIATDTSGDGLFVTRDTVMVEVRRCRISGFKMYPTPSAGLLTIEYNNTISGSLDILDISGRLLYRLLLPQGEQRLIVDIYGLDAGIYLGNIRFGEAIRREKIVLLR